MSLANRLIVTLICSLLIVGCANQHSPSDTPATAWVNAQNAQQSVPLQFETLDGGRKVAWGVFPAGVTTLLLNQPSPGVPEQIKLFRKVDLPAHGRGRFQIKFEQAGAYQILYSEQNPSHFRVSKRRSPKHATAPTEPRLQQARAQQCQPSYTPVEVDLSGVFQEGEWVRDFYSGTKQQVNSGKATFTPAPDSEGLLLLEAVDTTAGTFRWDNATLYFAMTDRFANGNPDNDNAYGRRADGAEEIGTFHGGDFSGLIQRLDYLQSLGVTALWISPPFEQIHGWVGGGDRGDFLHYAYHGYYIMDFTRLDANFGSEEELRQLISEAHARGIRVVLDVVMNHPGYATLQDMQTYGFGGLFEGFEQYLPEQWGDWRPDAGENYHSYHSNINYDHPQWAAWWGKDWVRAGIYDYDTPPNAAIDPVKGSLAFLPDFKTESEQHVDLPYFLQHKADTGAASLPNATVRDYLIAWLSGWVEQFGIDGFRVDTVKHVESAAWRELKDAASNALDRHRQGPDSNNTFSEPFWMVGEVFPHGVTKSTYFDAGFDALINFDFQRNTAKRGANCLDQLDPVYTDYAKRLNDDPEFNVLTYISSHDTQLFSTIAGASEEAQKRVAAALLLTPGAVQIYYGDESMRRMGPGGSDPTQGTRSDMNWSDIDSGAVDNILRHWQTIGQFRQRHPAIGAGQHRKLGHSPYAFSRVLGDDRVVIVSHQTLGNVD